MTSTKDSQHEIGARMVEARGYAWNAVPVECQRKRMFKAGDNLERRSVVA